MEQNVCQCGCGELLPEGSTRQYKRGHKARIGNPAAETGFTETAIDEPVEPDLFTIDDAARETPDDPEPKDEPEARPRTQLKITAALRRDVEGKLAFAFALSGQMWVMADPVCGGAFLNATPDIAKKLTPIVCQSPDVVKWLTKSSNFMLYVDLFMVCLPVVQIIIAHHIFHTVGAEVSAANGQRPASSDYVVR